MKQIFTGVLCFAVILQGSLRVFSSYRGCGRAVCRREADRREPLLLLPTRLYAGLRCRCKRHSTNCSCVRNWCFCCRQLSVRHFRRCRCCHLRRWNCCLWSRSFHFRHRRSRHFPSFRRFLLILIIVIVAAVCGTCRILIVYHGSSVVVCACNKHIR